MEKGANANPFFHPDYAFVMYQFRMKYKGIHNIVDAAMLMGGPIAREATGALFLLTWTQVLPPPPHLKRDVCMYMYVGVCLTSKQPMHWLRLCWAVAGSQDPRQRQRMQHRLDPGRRHCYGNTFEHSNPRKAGHPHLDWVRQHLHGRLHCRVS